MAPPPARRLCLLLCLLVCLARQRPLTAQDPSWPSATWSAGLPIFDNQVQLDASPSWRSYLHTVYGAETKFTFPVDVGRFNYFYRSLLPVDEQSRLPAMGGGLGGLRPSIDGWFDPSKSATHRGSQPTSVPALENLWVQVHGTTASCQHGSWPHKIGGAVIPDPALHLAGTCMILW